MAVLKNVVSKIFNLSTTPAKKTEGQFWYDTTNNVLKRSDGIDYKPLAVGDNLISAGSADTVKGLLNSKANASDLTNYLKKTGDNSLVLGNYENGIEGTILLNSDWDAFGICYTKITSNGISIYGDTGATWLSSTGISFGTTHNPGDTDSIMFSVYYNGITGKFIDTSLETELEDWKYNQHIPTSKAVYTALQSKADNTNVVHLSDDEVITGNKTFTSSIRFSSGDTFNTNLAGVSVPEPPDKPGTPPTLIIDSNSNITIDASNVTDADLHWSYYSYGIISGVNSDGKTFSIDGKTGSASFSSASFSSLYTDSIYGPAVVSTIGTSTTSSKLPTEGAVVTAVKAIDTSLANKQDKLRYYKEYETTEVYDNIARIDADSISLSTSGNSVLNELLIGQFAHDGIELYTPNKIELNADKGFEGSGVATTLGTSTTSAKLPTEGAVVKAISDVKTSLGSALTYEGSVENYSNLPTGLTASDKGKVYNVVNANGNIPAGTNYAWNGTSWDALGGDMSAYLRKEGDTSLSLGIHGTQQGRIKIFSDNEWAGSPTTLNYSGLSVCVPDEGWAYYTGSGIMLEYINGNLSIDAYSGFSGDTVDTLIPSTPEEGHIATTNAIKTYVDNSTSNKVEKNSDAELNAFIMPTYNSSGVQNGKAKIKLYKDDTTGAITIEAEEVE